MGIVKAVYQSYHYIKEIFVSTFNKLKDFNLLVFIAINERLFKNLLGSAFKQVYDNPNSIISFRIGSHFSPYKLFRIKITC